MYPGYPYNADDAPRPAPGAPTKPPFGSGISEEVMADCGVAAESDPVTFGIVTVVMPEGVGMSTILEGLILPELNAEDG